MTEKNKLIEALNEGKRLEDIVRELKDIREILESSEGGGASAHCLTSKGNSLRLAIEDIEEAFNEQEDHYIVPLPEVGQQIYIPTSLYLSHGADDFYGGLCTISNVRKENGVWISIEEDPHSEYPYEYLLEKQEELKEEFGDEKGKRCPDTRLEANIWATPGDIVDGKEINHYIL